MWHRIRMFSLENREMRRKVWAAIEARCMDARVYVLVRRVSILLICVSKSSSAHRVSMLELSGQMTTLVREDEKSIGERTDKWEICTENGSPFSLNRLIVRTHLMRIKWETVERLDTDIHLYMCVYTYIHIYTCVSS